MKLSAGENFPQLSITTSDGRDLHLPVPGARYTHVQFRRFSGCPVCNTHIAELRRAKNRLDAAGIHEVLFFHSTQNEVAAYHSDLPFDAVGDAEKRYYRLFGVDASLSFFSPRALGAAIKSIIRGDFGLKATGGPFGLPAEFLVAPDGTIRAAHYGNHGYDQWSIEELLQLAAERGTRAGYQSVSRSSARP